MQINKNILSNDSSPYLKQHKNNPVHWQTWSQETLNFAKKKKLNVDSLIKVLKNGAGQSWQLENRAKTMWKSEFNFGFMNKLMLKDLDIIIKEISQSDIKLPVTKIIKNNYQKKNRSCI